MPVCSVTPFAKLRPWSQSDRVYSISSEMEPASCRLVDFFPGTPRAARSYDGKDGEGGCGVENRVIVSGSGGLRELFVPGLRWGKAARLEGAGALCAGQGRLFCACAPGDVIWRLDAQSLMPTALFAGGPGIRALSLSADGKRLYALCGDADSLLMLDAQTGAPMIVNRVGMGPCAMAMDETGRVIAVAGGECARAVLLCASTLDVIGSLPMPGMVVGVALQRGMVHALCLSETLSSTLTTVLPGGGRRTLTLRGMPGTLSLRRGMLLAATHGHLYAVSEDGSRVLCEDSAAGRASRLLLCGEELLLLDMLGEALLVRERGDGGWRAAAEGVRDAATA